MLSVQLVLSDVEVRAACQNQSSQRCERHEDLLHVDIASFFETLFSASRTGYIRYAIAGPVKFSNNTYHSDYYVQRHFAFAVAESVIVLCFLRVDLQLAVDRVQYALRHRRVRIRLGIDAADQRRILRQAKHL